MRINEYFTAKIIIMTIMGLKTFNKYVYIKLGTTVIVSILFYC